MTEAIAADALPMAARRLIQRSVPANAAYATEVRLAMRGEIKLNRWMPFSATQRLVGGEGFSWNARAGGSLVGFSGSDSYWDGQGKVDFRLWGLLPVARASGADVSRSAVGRLAAETVVWLPQVLRSTNRAAWDHLSDESCRVSLTVHGEEFPILLTVDSSGQLCEVEMERWGNPGGGDYSLIPFGATFDGWSQFGGVTIPSSGTVGWWWNTDRQADGEFFRFQIVDASFS